MFGIVSEVVRLFVSKGLQAIAIAVQNCSEYVQYEALSVSDRWGLVTKRIPSVKWLVLFHTYVS